MAGAANYIGKENPDPRFNSFTNTALGSQFAETSGKNSNTGINYMRTKQGIFNGAFGSRRSNLTIESGGILDITQDSTSDIPIRRVIHINPFSGTTDTLIGIETDGIELPYQELIVIGVAGDTITVTHNSGGVSGTERAILCPGDTDYTLSGDEVLYLIYDTSLSKWVVISGNGTGGSGDDLGNHTATTTLDMANNNIHNVGIIYDGAGSGSAINMAGNLTVSASSDLSLSDGNGVFLTTDNTVPTVELVTYMRPFSSGLNLGDATHKWGHIYLQSGLNNSNIFLDGGGDTYITGSGNTGRINHYADGSIIFYTDPTTSAFNSDLDMNSNDISEMGQIKFASSTALTGSDVGWSGVTGDIYGNVPTGDSYFFRVNGATEVEIDADGIDIRNGWLELEERSTPAGLSNHARLYAKDNGAGKTQLVVIFGSGAEQVIATEP